MCELLKHVLAGMAFPLGEAEAQVVNVLAVDLEAVIIARGSGSPDLLHTTDETQGNV